MSAVQSALPKLVFHADAGREEGWGHLRECLSIAEVLRAQGIACGFIVPQESEEARAQVGAAGFALQPLPAATWQRSSDNGDLASLLAQIASRYLVSDLLKLPSNYATQAPRAAAAWAVITEHRHEEVAPVTFNISREPEYMPLQEAYRAAKPHAIREIPRRILISYGGSDPKNATGLTLEFLRQGIERAEISIDFEITVIIGPLFGHAAAVRALAESFPVPVRVVGPLAPEDFAAEGIRADIAITTGGGTMYEFCSLGLPGIIIPVLDKMEANARVLEERRGVVLLPRIDRLTAQHLIASLAALRDASARRALSSKAQAAVDGRGAERIAERLKQEWSLT